MATDQTPPGAARIVKTKRVQYVIQAADVTAALVNLEADFDAPFVDLNYTVTVSIEAVSPALIANYFVGGFSRTASKVIAVVEVGGTAAEGDVVILHVHAVRD
jgi:hypothetical protein